LSAADGADDARVRQVLREAGETIGARGRISDAQYARYDELSGAATTPPRPGGLGAAADGDGDWTAGLDDDGGAAAPTVTAAAEPPRLEAEQRPRTVKTAPGPSLGDRARGLAGRLAGGGETGSGDKPPRAGRSGAQGGRQKTGGAKAKAKPAQPWRPTAGVIGNIWRRAAMSAGALPPLQRILAAQAPMAGVALEGALRGSLVDRVLLQPAARWEAQTETVTAMAGVPLMVALITFRGRVQTVDGTPAGKPVITPDGRPVYTPDTELMMGGLKMCLMSWLAVSERHADEVIEQAEETLRLGRQADALLDWIFSGPPDPGASVDDLAAEARQAWAGGADGDPPPADPRGPGEPPPPSRGGASSAFAPALTGSVIPRGAAR
jgi:hypothetical protein